MLDTSEAQVRQIQKHLDDGKTITPIEALHQYGIFRLADVIFKLRKKNIITTTMIKQGRKQFAEYKLEVK